MQDIDSEEAYPCLGTGVNENTLYSLLNCAVNLQVLKKKVCGRGRAFMKQMLIYPMQSRFYQHKCSTTVYSESFYFQIQEPQYFVNNKLYEYRLKIIKES